MYLKFPGLLCLLLLLQVELTRSQEKIPVDSIYGLIKSHSIYKNKVDWQILDAQFESCKQSSKGNHGLLYCLVRIFESTNDFQSSLHYKNNVYRNGNQDIQTNQMSIDKLGIIARKEQGIITTSRIRDRYLYLRLPDLGSRPEQFNMLAQKIADSIQYNADIKIKGFIIDLRLNNGIQVSYILSGLHSLLGGGKLASEIIENQLVLHEWKIADGNFQRNVQPSTNIKASAVTYENFPVVIITSSFTRNAGSLAAISFKHRPNTYFVGEPTANGYSAYIETHSVTKELTLYLAAAYIKDRKGHTYPYYVPTDMLVSGGDHLDAFDKDLKIRMALRWLDKKTAIEK